MAMSLTRYVFSFPNIAWYGYRKQLAFGKLLKERFYSTSEHFHWFTLDSFRDMLSRFGLRITATAAAYACPRVMRLLPGRLRGALRARHLCLFGYQIVVSCKRTNEVD